jgi:membrane protease YdiL (CAAX protease family)
MARPGETEHASAEPSGERSRRPYPPPAYPPPAYPPPAYPPPAYPPPAYPPPAYPPPPYRPLPPSAPGGGWVPGHPGEPPGTAPVSPPATKGAAGFWLLMGLVGFAVGQVVGAIFVAVAAAVAGESGQLSKFATMAAPPEWYIGTSLVGLWTGFFLGPLVASKVRGTGRFVRDLGIRFRPADVAGIPIGLAGQVILDALYAPFIKHLKHFTAPTHRLIGAAHGWGFLAIAILTVVGAPFFEEILFRGLALRALTRLFTPMAAHPTRRRAAGVVLAVVVDGLLFGLAHWELYQFAGLAAFGMLLAIVSYKTGRLGMNMVAHASFNLVAVLAVLATSGGALH